MNGVRIAWLTVDVPELLQDIEKALIEWFDPPLNQSEVLGERRKVSLYIQEQLKVDLERLAQLEKRSLSNLIEVLLQQAVDKAELEGRLK